MNTTATAKIAKTIQIGDTAIYRNEYIVTARFIFHDERRQTVTVQWQIPVHGTIVSKAYAWDHVFTTA